MVRTRELYGGDTASQHQERTQTSIGPTGTSYLGSSRSAQSMLPLIDEQVSCSKISVRRKGLRHLGRLLEDSERCWETREIW